MLQVSRVIGMTMSQLAAANRGLGRARLRRGGRLRATRSGSGSPRSPQGVAPLLGSILEYALQLHMREQIRHDAFASAEISAGGRGRPIEIAVAFADLVGFTQLGERLEPEELGDLIAGRLGRARRRGGRRPGAAGEADRRRGDADVDRTPRPCSTRRWSWSRRREQEGRTFRSCAPASPTGRSLRAGATGTGGPSTSPAGSPQSLAREASLCGQAMQDALESGYDWSFAGARRLKGIEASERLFRARASTGDGD